MKTVWLATNIKVTCVTDEYALKINLSWLKVFKEQI